MRRAPAERRDLAARWPSTALLALAALAAAAPQARAWGFAAHRMVNRKAVATLPDPLRPLFQGNAAYVAEHSIDPDLERGGPGDPNHFFDLDAFGGPPFDIPRLESEHLARHGADAAPRGRLPWRVGEAYRELVAAFRAMDPARILRGAAHLGHFVADAHVPLHAVVNHDGQLTGQSGLHSRWESVLVERFERQLETEVHPGPAKAVGDPVSVAFEVLAASYARSADVFASDLRSVGPADLAETPEDDRYDDAYYSRLYEREAQALRQRLASAATALGSLWLTAWQEAGRPPLDGGFRFPYVRKQARAVLVSLDGAGAAALEDALARGVMPHLARLRAAGSTARGSVTSVSSRTAPGHASLFTGTWPDRNGISGNSVPVPGGSVLESNSGYSSTHLAAEPIWVTAARQGLRVTVASAPQVYPWRPFLAERRFGGDYGSRLTLIDGYQSFGTEAAVHTEKDLQLRPASGWIPPLPPHEGEAREVDLAVAGTRVDGLLYDDPADATRGLDTLYLGLDKDPRGGITLKATPPLEHGPSAFGALALTFGGRPAAVHFRLFTLSPDAGRILLYQTGAQVIRANKTRVETAAFEATGGFVGNGASRLYERGALGAPLWKGGDGTAERRYLDTVGLVARQFTRLGAFALERTDWDLLVTYLPYPDEAFHLWLGHLDARLPGHDAALASRLRPFTDRVLRVADDYLGHLAGRTGPAAILAVASDHGMVAANRVLKPNVALARAGILALDPEGRIDLARTRAVYFPGNAGHVLINRNARSGGVVPPEQEESVRREVVEALARIRDPASGGAVVHDVQDPRTAARGSHPARAGQSPVPEGIGGPAGGDLYLSLAPAYDISASLEGDVVESVAPLGTHVANPERPAMHAAFALAGPGVARGADLGLIRQIDLAPTLCALLGIEPPAQATGKVLRGALERLP